MDSNTVGFSTLASPFDNLLNPKDLKDHENAVRHAIYNAIAFAALLVIVAGGYYVLVVLNPFIVPIVWAILTGFVLHPYKTWLSCWLREALGTFEHSDSTAAATTVAILLSAADSLCDFLGNYVISHLKFLAIFIVVGAAGYFLYSFQSAVFLLFYNLFQLDLSFLEGVALGHVATLWAVFIVSLVFLYKDGNLFVLKTASVVLWSLIAIYLLYCLWTPLVYVGAATLIGAKIYAVATGKKVVPDDTEPRSPFLIRLVSRCRQLFYGSPSPELTPSPSLVEEDEEGAGSDVSKSVTDDTNRIEEVEEKEEELKEDEKEVVLSGRLLNPLVEGVRSGKPPMSSTPTVTVHHATAPDTPSLPVIPHPAVQSLQQQQLHKNLIPTPLRATSFQLKRDHQVRAAQRSRRYATARQMRTTFFRTRLETTEVGPDESAFYIRGVFTLCVLLQFYLHPGLLILFPFPVSYYLVKQALVYFGLMPKIGHLCESIKSWFRERKDVLLPTPVEYFLNQLCAAERQVLSSLSGCIDPLVTAFLIIMLIITTVSVGALVSFELYAESAHMVQTGRRIVFQAANSSVFRQLNESIYDPGYQDGIENVMESVYMSGREYISSTVHGMVGEGSRDSKATGEIELKVLELWDRMYQYWLSRKKTEAVTGSSLPIEYGPCVSSEALGTCFEELYDKVVEKRDHIFNYTAIGQFVQDNMGTLRAILEQSYLLLKGNMGFVFSLVLELLRLVASGGSGVVNLFLGIVVYFTALFYLLSESSDIYKPVELISELGTSVGDGFSAALTKAVKSIFKITFKMAAFYGMFTYLTHTLFNVSIVMVPVLAATFLAAVPVAGQYVVPVPGALELWLADDRLGAAILLVLVHTAPMMVVDATVYSEVKKGIHPWITGLSIVGGIYYFGVPGAIYGPLLVCAVFVLLSMYTGLLQELPQSAGGLDKTAAAAATSKFQTPKLQRSESVY